MSEVIRVAGDRVHVALTRADLRHLLASTYTATVAADDFGGKHANYLRAGDLRALWVQAYDALFERTERELNLVMKVAEFAEEDDE